jgi:hypothetical protein
MFGALPWLAIFFFGFAYVGGVSAWQVLKGRFVT